MFITPLLISLFQSTWDFPRKSQAFPRADVRPTILFIVRERGLAVYFPCLPTRCKKDYPRAPLTLEGFELGPGVYLGIVWEKIRL